MYYSFKGQQSRFKKVFDTFDFGLGYKCDYYREVDLVAIINAEPAQFLITMFCDSLLNSALHSYFNTYLYRVLERHHFTYNCYNVFDSSFNVTNKHPQFFFSFRQGEIKEKFIYNITLSYLMYHYEPLVKSLGERNAQRLYTLISEDQDIRASHSKVDPKITASYTKAIDDALREISFLKTRSA